MDIGRVDDRALTSSLERIRVCTTLAEDACSQGARSDLKSLPHLLASTITTLLSAHNDTSIDVRMAAEESLRKVAKAHIHRHGETIASQIVEALLDSNTTQRSRRAGWRVLAEVCPFVRPSRCRRLAATIHPLLLVAARTASVEEALGEAMQTMCPVIGRFFTEQEVRGLLGVFLANLKSDSDVARRTACGSVSSLLVCRSRPPVAFVVATLTAMAEGGTSKGGGAVDPTGLLLCALQIIEHASRRECDLLDHVMTQALVPHLPRLRDLASSRFDGPMGPAAAALELLHGLLLAYGAGVQLWGEGTTAREHVAVCLSLLRQVLFLCKDVRVGVQALAWMCLARLAEYFPDEAVESIPALQRADSGVVVLHPRVQRYWQDPDPTLRSNVAAYLAAVVRRFARPNARGSEQCGSLEAQISFLVRLLLRALDDTASVVRRAICGGIVQLMNVLLDLSSFMGWTLWHEALDAILALQSDSYWRVKAEALGVVGILNFDALRVLEGWAHIHRDAGDVSRVRGKAREVGTTQSMILTFCLNLLGDEDSRVRKAAATALVRLVPNVDKPLSSTPEPRVCPVTLKKVEWEGILYVGAMLLRRTRCMHPRSVVEGAYDALAELSHTYAPLSELPLVVEHLDVYWIGKRGDLLLDDMRPNPLGVYAHDVLDLTLDRVEATDVILDLNLHTRMVEMMGFFLHNTGDVCKPWFRSVLRHLLRVLRLLTDAANQRLPSGASDSWLTQDKNPLGRYEDLPYFCKLRETLVTVRRNATASLHEDKFTVLRTASLKSLYLFLGTSKSFVAPWTREIIALLVEHAVEEPALIALCLKGLVQGLLSAPRTQKTRSSLSPLPVVKDENDIHGTSDMNASRVSAERLVRSIAPLLSYLLAQYRNTHSIMSQLTVLRLVGTILRYGIELKRVDKDDAFLMFVLRQVKDPYHLVHQPSLLLPDLSNFVGLLSFEFGLFPKVISGRTLLDFAEGILSGPYEHFVVASMSTLVYHLYCSRAHLAPEIVAEEDRGQREQLITLRRGLLALLGKHTNQRVTVEILADIVRFSSRVEVMGIEDELAQIIQNLRTSLFERIGTMHHAVVGHLQALECVLPFREDRSHHEKMLSFLARTETTQNIGTGSLEVLHLATLALERLRGADSFVLAQAKDEEDRQLPSVGRVLAHLVLASISARPMLPASSLIAFLSVIHEILEKKEFHQKVCRQVLKEIGPLDGATLSADVSLVLCRILVAVNICSDVWWRPCLRRETTLRGWHEIALHRAGFSLWCTVRAKHCDCETMMDRDVMAHIVEWVEDPCVESFITAYSNSSSEKELALLNHVATVDVGDSSSANGYRKLLCVLSLLNPSFGLLKVLLERFMRVDHPLVEAQSAKLFLRTVTFLSITNVQNDYRDEWESIIDLFASTPRAMALFQDCRAALESVIGRAINGSSVPPSLATPLTLEHYVVLLAQRIQVGSHQPFSQLHTVLSPLDGPSFQRLLDSPSLDKYFLPDCIDTTAGDIFQTHILDHVASHINTTLQWAAEADGSPSDGCLKWPTVLDSTRCLSRLLRRNPQLTDSKSLSAPTIMSFLNLLFQIQIQFGQEFDPFLQGLTDVLELALVFTSRLTDGALAVCEAGGTWSELLRSSHKIFTYLFDVKREDPIFVGNPEERDIFLDMLNLLTWRMASVVPTYWYLHVRGSVTPQVDERVVALFRGYFACILRRRLPFVHDAFLHTSGLSDVLASLRGLPSQEVLAFGDDADERVTTSSEASPAHTQQYRSPSTLVSSSHVPRNLVAPFHVEDPIDIFTVFANMQGILGWNSESVMKKQWNVFHTIISQTSGEGAGLLGDEHIRRLAVVATTSLLLKVCWSEPGNPLSFLPHIPRSKEIFLLRTEKGRRLAMLRELTDSELRRMFPLTYEFAEDRLPVSEEAPIELPSFNVNIERHFASQKFGIGQASITRLQMGPYIRDPAALPVIQIFLFNLAAMAKQEAHLLLRREAIRAIFMLSDLFTTPNHEFMLTLFQVLLEEDKAEDTMVRPYLLMGMCKAVAVLRIEEAGFLHHSITEFLQNPQPTMQRAALYGILSLIEGRISSAILPLLPSVFPYLLESLKTRSCISSLNRCILAVSFQLIEHYPKQAEEQEFTRKFVQEISYVVTDERFSLEMLNAAFRGFERLIVSFSLSHSLRQLVVGMASKVLHAPNIRRRIPALGLVLTSLYTSSQQLAKRSSDNVFSPPDAECASPAQSQLPPSPSTPPRTPPARRTRKLSSVVIHEDTENCLMDLYARLRHRITQETILLGRILPTLLIDYLPMDKAVSTAVDQLIHTPGNPSLAAYVMFEVFSYALKVGKQGYIATELLLFLVNFKPTDANLYILTCILLAASRNKLIRHLFCELIGYFRLDEDIFLIGARDFYFHQGLDSTTLDVFLTSIAAVHHPWFGKLHGVLAAGSSSH